MLTRRAILLGAGSVAVTAAMPARAASWVDLGVRQVSLTKEADRIAVLSSRRFFTKLRLTVTGNDVFLRAVTVHFQNDVSIRYRFDTLIADGGRSASIDLPGDARRVQHVDLDYRRRAGGGSAIVSLQGMPV